jgi:hypothetical protein
MPGRPDLLTWFYDVEGATLHPSVNLRHPRATWSECPYRQELRYAQGDHS